MTNRNDATDELRIETFNRVSNAVSVREPQVFHITRANQLVPSRGQSYLLADPNDFLYRHDKLVSSTEYYYRIENSCRGRCKVENGSVLTITKAHWTGCEPKHAEISMRRFKKELVDKSKSDVITPFDTIYTNLSQRYPDARVLMTSEICARSMYCARRSVTTKRLPKTLAELGEWMQDVDYRKEYSYDLGTENNTFFTGIFDTADGHQFASFRSETICSAAGGSFITIELDGTFAVVPSEYTSQKKKFDDCHQLLMVHFRHRKRNYPIGYFLVSYALTTIMVEQILKMVKNWLGPNTTVRKIRSDYEKAIRIAAHAVFPNARIVGCAIHFQRAVAAWANKHGVYGRNRTERNFVAITRATALCYFPKEFFDATVHAIEIGVGNTAFGKKLIAYLKKTCYPMVVKHFIGVSHAFTTAIRIISINLFDRITLLRNRSTIAITARVIRCM